MTKSLLEPFPSNLVHPTVEVVEILWRIFYENGGPQALYGNVQHRADGWEELVPLDRLFFTHANISPTFSHGDKRGLPIRSLVDDLERGLVDMERDERLRLEVVHYDNRLYSLCNRRLFAFKHYQAILRQRHRDHSVQVRAWVRYRRLEPITAKFVLAFTTKCRGESVELRGSTVAAAPEPRNRPRS